MSHSESIRSVETIPLRIPFAHAFTMAAPGQQTRQSVDILLVKIHTEGGLCGIGETQAWRRQGSAETLENLSRTIIDHFVPRMLGRSCLDIAPIMHDLEGTIYGSLYAQAAIGDALYDAAGKTLGLPVWRLLGGQCRDRIQVGIAVSITSSPDALIDALEGWVAKGYRHLRLKVGIDYETDFRNASKVREHFGDAVVLRADANGGMQYGDALRLLRKLEALDFDIVEQPVAGWDLGGMAALARMVGLPLSADESLTTDHSLIEIIRRGAARVIQTKAGKNGGLYYSRRLWTIAEAAGVGIFPGNHPSTSISVASVAHLCASWPGRLLVGDFQTGIADMLAHDIVTKPLLPEHGFVDVPQGLGLGVEIDEDAIARFRIDGGERAS
ncbi:mandelate racemase/muconate lactonizing enzyme family protein [Shumkonia mesophila]|uniref:mandelate racemase/muconate lactonizing enzyme family protein n=1 Tax=Shumkonia mesophila TaxID=2838854 RepID=UPI002934FAA4|nr:enolase C-terminal domain-like protein [Shumkonia mesophila]